MRWRRLLRIGRQRKWAGLIAGLAVLLGTGFFPAAKADSFVQGFKTNGNLQPGLIVALSQASANTVEAAPANDSSRIYGVVINQNDAPVTLNQQGQKAFVASGGNFPVLVSTANGAIKPGDYVSMSNTDGIGAKATNQQPTVLGQALAGFDGNKNVISHIGGYAVGSISVTVNPTKNPLLLNDVAVPSAVRKIGETVAGKTVSGLRLYAALVVFIVAASVAGIMLWVGVRNGMVAIGRNPLSRTSIMSGLLQVIEVAVLIFLVGLFAIYLILKL